MSSIIRARNHYNPIDTGQNIIISHRNFCPHWERVARGKTIHIWRSDMDDNSCEFVASGSIGYIPTQHLVVNYKDGESLTKMNVSIEDIAQFSMGADPLLIHCTVGQTRSPTIAIIAKVVRGVSVYQALGEILKANWETRAVVSNFCLTPITEILEWAENRTD